jgi:hypothetical protein
MSPCIGMFDAIRFGMKALPKILLALTGVAALSLAYPGSVQAVPTTATAAVTATATADPGSFAAVILATEPANLKGYWKCNETSGRTLADSSGNAKNLNIQGTINTNYWLGETGEQGTCFRTDGVAGYAFRSDAVIPSLDNQDFTLFALFKGPAVEFNAAEALSITNSANEENRVGIGSDRGGQSTKAQGDMRGRTKAGNPKILGGVAFDGNWHSVMFKRTGNLFELFVDGSRVNSVVTTPALGSTSNRTSLMHALLSQCNPCPTYAKGSVQHAAIWNTALSHSEIMAIQTARNINPVPTTYQYTGNHFIDVAGPGYTTSMSVTGMVTLANPLPPNFGGTFGGPVTPTSFTFFDGVQTLTIANTAEFDIRFVTDATGNIIGWSVELIGQCSAYTPTSIGTRSIAPLPPSSDKGIYTDVHRGELGWARVLWFPGHWSGPLATAPDAGTIPYH